MNAGKRRHRRPFARILNTLSALVIGGLGCFAGAEIALWSTGPGNHLRMLAAETIITTRHRICAHLLTTPSEYQTLLASVQQKSENTGVSALTIADTQSFNASTSQPNVQVIPVSGSTYNGYVVLIHDPKTIRLVHADVSGEYGEYITHMAPRVGAVLGINASGFLDPGGEGWGGYVLGLEMIGGKVINQAEVGPSWTSVGFTKNGVMVMGNYSASQMKQLGVQDAMQFHPELVFEGKPMITSGDGGWGYAPRTAIGQAKDGTVIFVITNGRFHGGAGMGASQRQVMDLMLKYHAYNAVAMDGGSSTVLWDKGKIINSPSTIDPMGERMLPDAWMVFPSEQAAADYHP